MARDGYVTYDISQMRYLASDTATTAMRRPRLQPVTPPVPHTVQDVMP
jgi:hypothetical protein